MTICGIFVLLYDY